MAAGFVDEQQWTTVQERASEGMKDKQNDWVLFSSWKSFYCKNKIFHNSDINNLKTINNQASQHLLPTERLRLYSRRHNFFFMNILRWW